MKNLSLSLSLLAMFQHIILVVYRRDDTSIPRYDIKTIIDVRGSLVNLDYTSFFLFRSFKKPFDEKSEESDGWKLLNPFSIQCLPIRLDHPL